MWDDLGHAGIPVVVVLSVVEDVLNDDERLTAVLDDQPRGLNPEAFGIPKRLEGHLRPA